jgi:nitroreductase
MNWVLFALWVFVITAGCANIEPGVSSAGKTGGGNDRSSADKGALPKPIEKSDVDLLKALRGRHSTREFDFEKSIPDDILATVLWAADGVNRPDGKHTAPCAMGICYMRIYLCRADGVWRYDQDAHALVAVSNEDIRPRISRQKFMAQVPVVLVLASDLSAFNERAPKLDTAMRREWSHSAAGCIAQNVYLTAEAFGLGTVMAGGMNADEVRKGLSLKADEVPLYLMPLGYPKEK